MADINKYNPICRILLEQRRFYNGDPLAITKDLLSSYLDEFDCTETGLDEGRLMLVLVINLLKICKSGKGCYG